MTDAREPYDRAKILGELFAWVEDGKTVREFCRQDGMPTHRTLYDWMEKDKQASARFARAREIGFDAIAQECLAIADSPASGKVITEDKDGRSVRTEDMLGHRKLQIETRLKLLAKWDPKRYGDRTVPETVAEVAAGIRQFLRAAREQDEAEGAQ